MTPPLAEYLAGKAGAMAERGLRMKLGAEGEPVLLATGAGRAPDEHHDAFFAAAAAHCGRAPSSRRGRV